MPVLKTSLAGKGSSAADTPCSRAKELYQWDVQENGECPSEGCYSKYELPGYILIPHAMELYIRYDNTSSVLRTLMTWGIALFAHGKFQLLNCPEALLAPMPDLDLHSLS